ncbi:MAG: methyl-accepting chemotaxis protein [Oscillospiraceae bacterium]|nr:methyl-accepting chemotaxis protein [Oscillospiraceae bacterium]
MKNLKVAAKLMVSFLLIAFLTAAVGIAGIVGMIRIENSGIWMYENVAEPLPYLAQVQETLQNARVHVREMVIASMTDNQSGVEASFRVISNELMPEMTQNMDSFEKVLVKGSDSEKFFNEARSTYENGLVPVVVAIYEASKSQDNDTILERMEACRVLSDQILDNFHRCLNLKVSEAEQGRIESAALSNTLLILIIAVLVIALSSAVFLSFFISRIISRPLSATAQFFKSAATTGEIVCTPEIDAMFNSFKENKDEIGQMIADCDSFIARIIHISDELESVANGDLTINVDVLSAADTIGVSLKKMVDNLNNMFGDVNSSTEQVSMGSRQIAGSSQSLAQGATEQAAAIEQLSASITEISTKTQDNASMAGRAAELANVIKVNAEKGSEQMSEMMEAVKDINEASQSISKVIKVIDDIAFQTNILALNAAVEAARAGQHGKGFAVVAEEVRNLASKSAEAAKDTGVLIANSIEKAELGSRIADETAASLAEIVSGINESNEIVNDIARSSEEQSVGIAQINQGIEQVTQVVQQNSATAEESAAASQEMSGQSDVLEELIGRFKLKV